MIGFPRPAAAASLVCAAFIWCLGLTLPSAQSLSATQLGLHLAPCVQGRGKVPALCGTFGVYENRAAHSGRIIPLNLVLVKAKHHARGVIAEIGGGPGEGAASFAPWVLDGDFGKARQSSHDDYDYLFVDNRGMGDSSPLTCDLAPADRPQSYFRYLFPPDLVRQCRTRNAKTHNLPLYNTNIAVDDLDDVRAALGYGKIILDGGSYGTFFSLVYMRRHPQHVQAAILDGVTAPHFQTDLGSPEGAQTALDDLFVKCRRDNVCNSHFPRFAQHFTALVSRFDAGPIAVPLFQSKAHDALSLELSKGVLVDQLRHMLYDPIAEAYLPYIVERAYNRDYAPLAQMIQTVVQGIEGMPMGAFLSYSCADLMPFITPQQIAFSREHTFAGDLRIRAQQQACVSWNVPAMPASFNDPVRSNAPVLMILGSDDPATPPQYGEEALRYLPNGRAIVVEGAGHGADNACTDELRLQFLRTGSAKGLDVSKCTATFEQPQFALSMKDWPSATCAVVL